MGGNPWHYFACYDANINSVLQTLREQEFRAGRFGRAAWFNDDAANLVKSFPQESSRSSQSVKSPEELLTEYGTVEKAIEAVWHDYGAEARSSIFDLVTCSKSQIPRESPEELIAKCGSVQAAIEAVLDEYAEEGTSSILDMQEISLFPQAGAVSPVPENELIELFGTDQPTREMVVSILIEEADQEAWETFWESINRGEGRYIVIYSENQPVEIFFAGYSFD
ncbi:hypothetical protein CLI64_21245 [Nostoc sp. CENA543]|uniref:hypothetical protein n=1 Tax=Nostoc sp. CENA543 TaxID=1869241 RepID=UPI000CA0F045|nr:hypothetical protein [Nostoc sp. CENA543]AUT02719.1 hypothetical protein CLI64_21245 [Nostoc sp. CENA543]